MSKFNRGDSVRIARDLYPGENGSRFVGQVGTVRTATADGVTIAGLDPAYKFFNDEIEKA